MKRELEVAWAAGLFEGEGCFRHRSGTRIAAFLNMTDRDVVERFARIVGHGTVRWRDMPAPRKRLYTWEINAVEEVREMIAMFRPYLGERRGARADELLRVAAGNRGALAKQTHCKNGHPLSGDNLYVNPASGYRQCRTCRRTYMKQYHAERLRSADQS